eukprot:4532_1
MMMMKKIVVKEQERMEQIMIPQSDEPESNVENIINHDEQQQQSSSEAEIIISKSCRYVFNPNAPQSIAHNINDDMNAWRPHIQVLMNFKIHILWDFGLLLQLKQMMLF